MFHRLAVCRQPGVFIHPLCHAGSKVFRPVPDILAYNPTFWAIHEKQKAGTFRPRPFVWCEWGDLNPHEHTLTAT